MNARMNVWVLGDWRTGGTRCTGWSLEVEYRRVSRTSWATMRWANDRWRASGFGQVDKLDEVDIWDKMIIWS